MPRNIPLRLATEDKDHFRVWIGCYKTSLRTEWLADVKFSKTIQKCIVKYLFLVFQLFKHHVQPVSSHALGNHVSTWTLFVILWMIVEMAVMKLIAVSTDQYFMCTVCYWNSDRPDILSCIVLLYIKYKPTSVKIIAFKLNSLS